jgi:short-subunit dehydrogenase involved in D-alanine esterification of teichoic acids
MKQIIIFGATGGIGESFARRFHAMGKKVIITGRRQARLTSLADELPGVETYKMDNADIASIPNNVKTILSRWPDIDTGTY